jgi:anti-sigma factor RsiW
MNCEEIKKYLDDYILGEIDPVIEIQISEHLAECQNCQKEIKEREVVIESLKTSEKFEPPNEVYTKIKDDILIPRKEKRLLWGIPKRFSYAAASFVIGVILMHTADVLFLPVENAPKVEIRYEPTRKVPFSDTVQFHSAPAKNLARI